MFEVRNRTNQSSRGRKNVNARILCCNSALWNETNLHVGRKVVLQSERIKRFNFAFGIQVIINSAKKFPSSRCSAINSQPLTTEIRIQITEKTRIAKASVVSIADI